MADIAQILRLRRSGMSLREIGRTVGLSRERVSQLLETHGDPYTNKIRTRSLEARRVAIIRLFHQGLSQQAIAAELGMKSYTRVGDVLREAGLSRRAQMEEQKRVKDAEILALRQQGLNYGAIVERLGLASKHVVAKSLARSGVKWKEPTNGDEVLRLRLEGLSPSQIAMRLGITSRRVLYALQKVDMAQRRGKRK